MCIYVPVPENLCAHHVSCLTVPRMSRRVVSLPEHLSLSADYFQGQLLVILERFSRCLHVTVRTISISTTMNFFMTVKVQYGFQMLVRTCSPICVLLLMLGCVDIRLLRLGPTFLKSILYGPYFDRHWDLRSVIYPLLLLDWGGEKDSTPAWSLCTLYKCYWNTKICTTSRLQW